MTPRPVHLDGPAADDDVWTADPIDDSVDWNEMESAMLDARRAAYETLRDLDAA